MRNMQYLDFKFKNTVLSVSEVNMKGEVMVLMANHEKNTESVISLEQGELEDLRDWLNNALWTLANKGKTPH